MRPTTTLDVDEGGKDHEIHCPSTGEHRERTIDFDVHARRVFDGYAGSAGEGPDRHADFRARSMFRCGARPGQILA